MKYNIEIFDTTLRDGEQSPGFSMNIKDKVKLALQIEKLKVDIIEAGFPIASDGDFNAVKEISKTITKCKVAGLCRTKKVDIDRAWEALQHAKKPRIHTFIATSDLHIKHKLNKTKKEVLEDVTSAVKYAKSLCDDVEFSAEDGSRSDWKFLVDVFNAAVESGANVINIPDTVGYSLPEEFGSLVKYVMDNVYGIEDVAVSVHCHNDLGLAVANSLTGIQNGATQVECTVNGIGERAGNASMEEIVMTLKTRQKLLKYNTKIDTTEIYPTSKLLEKITSISVQPNKAIVGKNAFAHEAGIHQDGVLKNPLTYEIMTPQSIGAAGNSMVIGKHSGRHALSNRMNELGYKLSKDVLDIVYKETMRLTDKKKIINDKDLISVVKRVFVQDNPGRAFPDYDKNMQTYIML